MAALVFLAVGQRWTARDMAESILGEDSNHPWALAAFVAFEMLARNLVPYFLKGNERLRFIWVYRFNVLEEVEASRLLCRLIMTYGSEFERQLIREDLFTQYPPDDVM
jgi:hypothetical protein